VQYYERNSMGRVIDRDAALAIIRAADRAGLVLQPSNARRISNICMCCGCCCGVLRTIKKQPRPSDYVSSPFRATYGPGSCTHCGTCVRRCPMEALTRGTDGAIRLAEERCIGCGLCVSTCPSGSLRLARKPRSAQRQVPLTLTRTYLGMARRRGKLRLSELAGAWLRTKIKARPDPRP